MDLWREINWYAIQTKPCREDLAAINLERLGLELFLPKVKLQEFGWGVPRVITKPLFPGYLFAKFCPLNYLHLVRYARGVRRVVSAGEVILPVDEQIIRTIQSRIREDLFMRLRPSPFHAGDLVKVQEGSLQGLSGIFERELDDRERVVILLEAIAYRARVLIEKRYLTSAAVVLQ
jgi:transcriptional antiterminator RfaH